MRMILWSNFLMPLMTEEGRDLSAQKKNVGVVSVERGKTACQGSRIYNNYATIIIVNVMIMMLCVCV